jgi:hypothetical protein
MKYLTATISSCLRTLALFLSCSVLSACVVKVPAPRSLAEGQVGHAESGIVFPEMLGAFKRGEVESADEAGLDVSAEYTRFHLRDRLNATVFVYPSNNLRSWGSPDEVIRAAQRELLERSFEGVKQDILSYHPGAKLVLEDSSELILFDKKRDVEVANYIYTEGKGFMKITYYTTASLIAVDQWLVLFRLTAPEDSAGRSLEQISGFFQAFMEANDGSLLP